MQKSKTICFFNSNKAWGGGEKWHAEYALALKEKKHNVIVFTNSESELYKRLEKEKIDLYKVSVSNTSFLNPLKINQLSKKFKELKIDIIILNLPSDLKFAGKAAKKAGISKIIYRRGSAIRVKNNSLNRKLLNNVCTGIIANSHETKRKITESGVVEPEKIHVIYNGLKFKKQNTISEQKKSGNKFRIGSMGRLDKQKAYNHLIDIASILAKKDIDFIIEIAGTGDLESELKEQIKEKNLKNKVILKGFIENTDEFLQSLDLFVSTSLWEGFGYVIAEAMLQKLPVIAFDLSSNPELIQDNKNGYLIPAFDKEIFAEKIISLMADDTLRKEMGINASEIIKNNFSFNKSLEILSSYLEI